MDEAAQAKLLDALMRIQVSGGIEGNGGKNKYLAGGGRLGYSFPLANGDLTLGVSGKGYTEQGFRDVRPTGIDASYSSGNNTYGVDYQTHLPKDEKLLNFYMQHNF